MADDSSATEATPTAEGWDVQQLSRMILGAANRDIPRVDFLHQVCRLLLEYTGAASLEICLAESATMCAHSRVHRASDLEGPEFSFELIPCENPADDEVALLRGPCQMVRTRLPGPIDRLPEGTLMTAPADGPTLVLQPLAVGDEGVGWLLLEDLGEAVEKDEALERLRDASHALGIALVNQRAQAALRERVKELTCLYRLAQLAERPGTSLAGLLEGVAALLPPAWQYPEVTAGAVVLDDVVHATPGLEDAVSSQTADIVVAGRRRGRVEVAYTTPRPTLDEGPFLREERSLIDAIAREVAVVIERREAAEERARLQDQLRHADRLATIGQLAAGVAHELNEPLGNILGFAQLAQKTPDLSGPAAHDLERIVAATLHAREVIKKLMLFGRQTPPRTAAVDLNQVVEDSLYFLEARCARGGIDLIRDLAADLPAITADPSQLQQVVVNLVVNAIQAMPAGGRLILSTRCDNGAVCLGVRDTGVGMSSDVASQVYLPFFTTKDVDQGTGLGLAVVHGIVTAHGGSIRVETREGEGSFFEVVLPVKGPRGEAS